MRIFSIVALISCLTFELSCSSTNGFQLELQQDALVGSSPGALVAKKRGEKIAIQESATFVTSPGFEPLLVLPLVGDGGVVKVSLAPLAASTAQCKEPDPMADVSEPSPSSDINRQEVNARTAKAVALLLDTQIALAEGKSDRSKLLIEEALTKYPEVSYTYFLQASLQALAGDTRGAVASLERGLQDHPQDERGVALFRELTGKDYQPSGSASQR